MENNFTEAMNEPTGTCMQNAGKNDCAKWPDRFPSPCCWLSCSEICGAACLRPNNECGEKCEYYGGEYCDGSSFGKDIRHGQRRMAGA